MPNGVGPRYHYPDKYCGNENCRALLPEAGAACPRCKSADRITRLESDLKALNAEERDLSQPYVGQLVESETGGETVAIHRRTYGEVSVDIEMNRHCLICGREKGQPPERCQGHCQVPIRRIRGPKISADIAEIKEKRGERKMMTDEELGAAIVAGIKMAKRYEERPVAKDAKIAEAESALRAIILAQWEAVCEAASKEPWRTDDRASLAVMSDRICVASCGGYSTNQMEPEELTKMLQANADFIAAARTGWPATIKALRVLMQFAEHEDLLWGDPENPAAKVITKATAILEGRDAC